MINGQISDLDKEIKSLQSDAWVDGLLEPHFELTQAYEMVIERDDEIKTLNRQIKEFKEAVASRDCQIEELKINLEITAKALLEIVTHDKNKKETQI